MKKLFFKYWKYLVVFILILIIFVINLNYNEDDSYENISEIQEINESDEEEKNTKFVEIKGEVRNPGVYEVGDVRIIDVVKLAGGLTDEVDTSLLNLSKKVADEMYIKIYSKKEVEDARNRVLNKEPTVIEVIKEIEKECVCPDVNNDACINNSDNNNTFDLNVSNENSNENVLVNINTASKSELMTIKGIGDKKAEKIIEYRTSNKFLKIEDIMNVSGIGEAMFEKIKNYITV